MSASSCGTACDWSAATLIARFQAGGPVDALLKGLARCTDALLRQLAANARLEQQGALVAVGGYGRGELFPHSDVDVLILLERAPDDAERATIERLIGLLWDFGFALGHSVRTVEECQSEAAQGRHGADLADGSAPDHRFARPVHPVPARRSTTRSIARPISAPRSSNSGSATSSTTSRRTTSSPTSRKARADCATCTCCCGLPVRLAMARRWAQLARSGLITAEEAGLIRRSERRLKEIRAWLHLVTDRREDRLVFDVQHAVAQRAGFHPTAARRASEVMMQRYYWAAKAVTQMNTIVLQNVELRLFHRDDPTAQPLDETFVVRSELLDLSAPDALDADPNGILRAFLLMAQHRELRGMSAPLMRALWHARVRIDARYRRDPRNRATFLEILQQPKGVLHELRRMNQLSVLGRYLPVFRRIVGQMQHDLFHVYTVDQHILQVLRNLRRFALAEHAHEYPLCSQLITDFERPWLLYIAALFHDIAKGRGGDHSTLGARDARRFCREHGLSAEDTGLVVFLVEHHLSMSQVAQKQDLADERVIARFAAMVQTDRRLTALYLLTVADIRGTSPKVWNAWKGKLLEDLFLSTRRLLGGGSVSSTAVLEGRKEEALRILRLYGLTDSAREALWEQFDVVYFLRHSAQDIAWHTRSLYARVNTEQPIVRARLARIGEGAEVLMYVRDQKDLFARVCGYFDSRNLSILDARIHTTRHGYALDTFLVTDHGRSPHYRELLAQIEHELAEWIAQRHELPAPVKGRMSRQSRHFPVTPEVHLQPDERGSRYLVAVTATDRLGLLYSIARVLTQHSLNVHTAKVLTLGERAEDVFLVSGAELDQPRSQLEIEKDLLQALEP